MEGGKAGRREGGKGLRDLALVWEAVSGEQEVWPAWGLLGGGQSAGLAPRPQGLQLQYPLLPGQAMNTLHELQITQEFKKAVQEAYPQLLLALLTQIHYILELSLPTGPQPGQQAPEAATPSPQR